jgi:hypothetical protein
VQAGDWRRLQPIGGVKTRTASEIRNYKQALVGPALLLTENAQGERFGIFAFSGKGDRHLLENRMRPEQLRSAWSWITKKPLPVAVHHDAPYLWPILNRTADGRLVIGVVNLSTDVYESLPLLLDKTLASEVVLAVQPQGGLRPVIYVEAETPDSQTVRYEVQQRLEPFEVAALVLE